MYLLIWQNLRCHSILVAILEGVLGIKWVKRELRRWWWRGERRLGNGVLHREWVWRRVLYER
jgi:hypothetical protein